MTEKRKAKRIVKNFNFQKEGASVHLVSTSQGGAANGFSTLIMKSNKTSDLPDVVETEQTIEKSKLKQITVTLSMQEFLQKFFNMWYDDAELLTAILGFETEYENYSKETEDKEPMTHGEYIKEKLQGFEVMKSMHEKTTDSVSALDHLTVLELQDNIEKKLIENEENMTKVHIEKSRLEAYEQAEADLNTQLNVVKSLESKNQELETELAAVKQELETINKAKADAALEDMKGKLEGLVEEEQIETMAKSMVAMDAVMVETVLAGLEVKKAAAKPEVKDIDEDLTIEKGRDVEANVDGSDKRNAFEEQLKKSQEALA